MSTAKRKSRTHIDALSKDKRGNFGMITALVLPMGIFVVGMAMDTMAALELKQNMQITADSAALAAASSISARNKTYTVSQAEEEAKELLVSQLSQSLSHLGKDELREELNKNTKVTVSSPNAEIYQAVADTSVTMPLNAFTRLFAGNGIKLSVTSTSSAMKENKTGLSMYLALDRSGSMSFKSDTRKLTSNGANTSCVNYTEENWRYAGITNQKDKNYLKPESPCYIRKIEALQAAANTLFKTFNEVDPDQKRVRVGAVAYTHDTYPETTLAWGTSKATDYVNALPYRPEGGTDSSGSMAKALAALRKTNTTESAAHTKMGNKVFNRYVLLMTDGKMTGNSSAWNEKLDKDTRDLCQQAKNDGIVVFSVAFMAPIEGKNLLGNCATDASHYYEASDMNSLVKAFKDIATKATEASVRLTN